jgi:hypothetical protein
VRTADEGNIRRALGLQQDWARQSNFKFISVFRIYLSLLAYNNCTKGFFYACS